MPVKYSANSHMRDCLYCDLTGDESENFRCSQEDLERLNSEHNCQHLLNHNSRKTSNFCARLVLTSDQVPQKTFKEHLNTIVWSAF